MSSRLSPQTQGLQSKVFRRAILQVLLFTLSFAILGQLVDALVFDYLGESIANYTSSWVFMPQEDYANSDMAWNSHLQVIYQDDGSVAIRDLTTYYALREAKNWVGVALFIVGIALIWRHSIRKSFTYVDEISNALTSSQFLTMDAKLGISDDLFETRAAIEELRRRVATNEYAAKQAERRKNELVAYLAHDIKTPLTSIVGYLELLCEAPELTDEKRRDFARRALDKSERLEGLMDEFFEITRYNLQTIPIERSLVDLRLFCEQCVDEFVLTAEERGQTIEVDAPSDTMVFIDASKMARALGNIIRNALAYGNENSAVTVQAKVLSRASAPLPGGEASREGAAWDGCETTASPSAASVTDTASGIGDRAAANGGFGSTQAASRPRARGIWAPILESLMGKKTWTTVPAQSKKTKKTPAALPGVGESALGKTGVLEITVSNEGREISAIHLQRIFEKFYRADESRSQGEEGHSSNAGLGLAIAREILQAHGGVITATSTGGVTTFTMDVPLGL